MLSREGLTRMLGQISVLFGLAGEFVLVSLLPVSLSLILSFSLSAPSLTPSLSLSLLPVSLSLTLSFLLPASSLASSMVLSLLPVSLSLTLSFSLSTPSTTSYLPSLSLFDIFLYFSLFLDFFSIVALLQGLLKMKLSSGKLQF
jgi:hypothetical protein